MIRAEEQPSSNSVAYISESAAILDKKIQPFRVSFDHLTYSVKTRKKEIKNLLDDVSASLEHGKLTAIIGASGAGKVLPTFQSMLLSDQTKHFVKTTLLNILAGRAKKDGDYK